MALNIGPQSIVTNGLILDFDAGNVLNYLLYNVEVLVVAGGGGGGSFNGGGGGAGGLIYSPNTPVTPGSPISVTVGLGGLGDGRPGNGATGASGTVGTNGGNSVFGTLTAIGGGVGATYSVRTTGTSGGSGGGSWGALNFASGTTGQGNSGGGGYPIGNNYTETAGGGGGAGSPGSDGGTASTQPGSGGRGLSFNISGTSRYYAAGGGAGSNRFGGSALGGSRIGGNGGTTSSLPGQPGAPNTGSGGGGAAYNATPGSSADGGAGGTGVVIVRYPGPQKATGGNTIANIGGYTIHTFTSSGTFTPLSAPVNGGTAYGLQDLSGNNNTATQSGGVTYSTANGGAFVFDGVNDFLSVTNTNNLRPPDELTIGMWVKSNSITSGWVRLFGQNPYQGGPLIFLETGGTFIRALHYPNGVEVRCNTEYPISTTNYTYTVFTFKMGDAIRSYFNGSPSTAVSLSTGTFSYNNINPYLIGHQGASWFNGNIANVSFYDRALTATEIQQNFNAQRGRFGI